MDIRQLKYFVAIAEEGNITAAAKRLHISQPPLSQQLKKLEDDLGLKLFKRNSRNIQLTDAGKLFLLQAQQVILLCANAEKQMRDLSRGNTETLQIGATPTTASISDILLDFQRKNPHINYRIYEGDTWQVTDLIHKNIAHIGIIRSPSKDIGLNSYSMPPEPMTALIPSNLNTYNQAADSLKLRELVDKPLILTTRYEEMVSHALKEYDDVRYVAVTDRAITALKLAQAGLGIALLPDSLVEKGLDNLTYKKLENKELSTAISIIWSKQYYLSKTSQELILFLKERLSHPHTE